MTARRKGRCFITTGRSTVLLCRSLARLLILSGLYELKRERLFESLGTIFSAGNMSFSQGTVGKFSSISKAAKTYNTIVNWHIAASGQHEKR